MTVTCRARPGITLLELIVAVAVFSILMTAIALIFSQGFGMYRKSVLINDLKDNLRQVATKISVDLRQACQDPSLGCTAIQITNRGSKCTLTVMKNFTTVPTQSYQVAYWYDSASQQVYEQLTVGGVTQPSTVIAQNIVSFTITPINSTTFQIDVTASKFYQNQTLSTQIETLAENRYETPSSYTRQIVPTSKQPQGILLDRQEREYEESKRWR